MPLDKSTKVVIIGVIVLILISLIFMMWAYDAVNEQNSILEETEIGTISDCSIMTKHLCGHTVLEQKLDRVIELLENKE